MKTAISMDDGLMEQADQAARDLGLSRSGLIAQALQEYLKQRRRVQITKQLNEAYAGSADTNADERRLIRKLKTKVPVQGSW